MVNAEHYNARFCLVLKLTLKMHIFVKYCATRENITTYTIPRRYHLLGCCCKLVVNVLRLDTFGLLSMGLLKKQSLLQ